MSENTLLTVNQFSEKHKAFTTGALRSYIFNEKKIGFTKVIRRVNGRLYINEQDFFEWIDEINAKRLTK